MGRLVNDLLLAVMLGAPGVFVAVLCAIKRVSAFDLELRAHREQVRLEYLEAARAARVAAARLKGDSGPAVRGRAKPTIPGADLQVDIVLEGPEPSRAAERFGLRAWSQLSRVLSPRRRRPRRGRPNTEVPAWALACLSLDEAKRASLEWGAHLHERVRDGEAQEARVDRRRFVRRALVLGLVERLRRKRTPLR